MQLPNIAQKAEAEEGEKPGPRRLLCSLRSPAQKVALTTGTFSRPGQ